MVLAQNRLGHSEIDRFNIGPCSKLFFFSSHSSIYIAYHATAVTPLSPRTSSLSVVPCIRLDTSGRAQWNSTLSQASGSLLDVLMNQSRVYISHSVNSEFELRENDTLSPKYKKEIATFIAEKSSLRSEPSKER